ncbi:MAG TPA: methyltransferase domain-containing protein [Roseiarcus sp.]|nr:methyltransferase domain-containing protein [Roseiarcus sp.]
MNRDEWSAGTDSEIQFWKFWLGAKGAQWPDDYAYRIDPNTELQYEIAEHIQGFHGDVLKLLDVGAGPMTIVAKRFRGAPIDLTAVDALADRYDELDFPPGLPLVRTLMCDSERLSEKFGENVFDVVYARNTLDHGYEPIKAIIEMVKVAKPGGTIITVHLPNEATVENWVGFHQWNFYVEGADFKIANRTKTFNVASAIADLGRIVRLSPPDSPTVACVIEKL